MKITKNQLRRLVREQLEPSSKWEVLVRHSQDPNAIKGAPGVQEALRALALEVSELGVYSDQHGAAMDILESAGMSYKDTYQYAEDAMRNYGNVEEGDEDWDDEGEGDGEEDW